MTFFDKYEFSQDMLKEHCLFVSDNGSNMILALNEFQRIPCACHMLATVLSHTLQLKSLSKNCCPINENDPSLSIVEDTYFKQTGLNKKLKTSLKQSNDTRWNTTLYMLLSYNECKDEIEAIIHAKWHSNLLFELDILVVLDLIKFLQPFGSNKSVGRGQPPNFAKSLSMLLKTQAEHGKGTKRF